LLTVLFLNSCVCYSSDNQEPKDSGTKKANDQIKKGFGIFVSYKDFAKSSNDMSNWPMSKWPDSNSQSLGVEIRSKNMMISFEEQKYHYVAVTRNITETPLWKTGENHFVVLTIDYIYKFDDRKVKGFYVGAGGSPKMTNESVAAWNLMLGYDFSKNIGISYVRNWSIHPDIFPGTSELKLTYTIN
jgi:hypothetical protein